MQDNIKEEILKENVNLEEECNCDCGEDCKCNEEVTKAANNGIDEKVNEEVKVDSKDEIEKLRTELEDWKQSYLRKQADFQNFSKRKEKELDELRKFSSEKIITKFLGSLDNLERAIEASNDMKDFDALVKGVEMIIRGLKDIMSSEGVEEIKTEGECNPEYHHAVSVETDENFKENEIVRVLQKGYTMKGKVIRPAMVSVKK